MRARSGKRRRPSDCLRRKKTMRKDYGELVAEKLKKEGLTPVDGTGLRLAGFRAADRVRVEFADDGSVLVDRRRNCTLSIFRLFHLTARETLILDWNCTLSIFHLFHRRREKHAIRLRKVYSPEELERTLRENGIEWLGFDEKDILRPVYDDAYPGRENSHADALVYLRPWNRAHVKIESEAAARWCSESGIFRKNDFRPRSRFDCDNVCIKALVDNMKEGNLKVLVRSRDFWIVRSSRYGRPLYEGHAPWRGTGAGK